MRQMYQMRRRARYNRDWAFPAPGSLPMGLRDVDNRPQPSDGQVDLCPLRPRELLKRRHRRVCAAALDPTDRFLRNT